MPRPGYRWRHLQINTYCSWLKGDKRGFRARKHEIHSTGDYRNPPPQNEHEGLRRYFAHVSKKEVHIEHACREIIGQVILREFLSLGIRILAIAVAKVHAHLVLELPDDMRRIRAIVGDVKRKSSRSVKKWMPGKVWSRGEHAEPVNDRSHLKNATEYVIYDQGPDAWTWWYRDQNNEGTFAREMPADRARRKKHRKHQR